LTPPHQRAVVRQFIVSSVIAVLAFAMAFVSGYLFGRADEGPRPSPIAAVLAPLERVVPGPVRAEPNAVLTAEEQERFKVFWETWGVVEKEFYNRGALDHQKMTYGAIKGMVDALGDPYTVYLTPANRELTDSDLKGSFDGVGIQVDMRDGKLTVVSPIEGSPADQAGVKPGDIVTMVDGKSLQGKTLNDTVLLIRGQRGTPVTLTVTRPDVPDPLTFTLVRAEIKLESVKARMLDDGVGYLRIANFASNTATETTRLLNELLTQQPKGVVIDLRSNPGGYLHSAVDVANELMNEGVVLYQDSGNGDRQTYRVDPGGVATDARLVVLVNKGTASASEILAAALRDNGRAVLIGEPTFGKGTVQNVHELSDRSGLRVTTAQWLTPGEQPLQGVGLTPDIAAPNPTEGPTGPDPQLDAAVRYLLEG
jgi:carboxyl-terminal processing protease